MKKDSTAYYDIKSKIFNFRQETLSVIEYYGTLNELWIELDQYQGLKMCKGDSIILGKEKLSSLSEVFFIVRSEETRQSVMLDKGNSNTGSAMELTTGRTIGVAKEHGGLYYLQHTKIGNNTNKEELPSSQRATSNTWAASQIWLYHKHLGYLRQCFHIYLQKSLSSPLSVIFVSFQRPASNFILRAKWFVSFIDDCTCVTWIFLMKHKYEVCQIFVNFFCLVKNQFNKFIKRLRLENGTKFINLEFSKFLKDNRMVHELTCVNTPQQNGVAEKKNRHLIKVARALLSQMSVPNVYWGETVLTTTYLINRLPTQVLNGISPIKHMLSFFPSSPLMLRLPSRVFGCVVFVHSHNPHRGKLDPRAVKCVFIGYPSNKNGFKCYHLPSRWFFVSMDITFHETQSYFVCPPFQGESYLEVESVIESLPFPTQDVQEVTKFTLVPEQVQMSKSDVSIPNNSIEEQVQLSKSEVSIPDNSIEDYPISQFMCADHLFVQHQSFIVVIDAIKTPTSVQEALKDEN
ncbi:hypothetical protein CR513_51414, partial [Mucuna pruriens]